MSINLPICRQNNHKLCNEYMTDHAGINQMIFFSNSAGFQFIMLN